jgi:hypothetical protein
LQTLAYEPCNACVEQLKIFFRACESPSALCAAGALSYIQCSPARSTERAGTFSVTLHPYRTRPAPALS